MSAVLFDTHPAIVKAQFPEGFPQLAKRFFLGKGEENDTFRDNTFKIVPRIVEGPRVVRIAVASKPAIIGRKLKQRYFFGDKYMELDIDIGASVLAWKITQFVLGYVKMLTVDIAMVLEATEISSLPEQVLGMSRWVRADFSDMCNFRPTFTS